MHRKTPGETAAGARRGLTGGWFALPSVLSAMLLAATAHAGDFGGFAEAVDINIGSTSGIHHVATADVDLDGDQDIVVAAASSLLVVKGHGDGTFESPEDFSASANPAGLLLTDFTGNGYPDAAVLHGQPIHIVSFYINDGTGVFALESSNGTGINPKDLVAADFNGDDHCDVIVVTSATGDHHARVVLGNGNGTFVSAGDVAVGYEPRAIAAGDLDSDGHMDFAVSSGVSSTYAVTSYLGVGNGTFGEGVTLPAPFDAIQDLVISDFNNDGHVDIGVAHSQSSTVKIHLNSGQGTFAAPVSYDGPDILHRMLSVDLNGDGHQDVVAGRETVGVFINSGDGAFQPVFETALPNTMWSVDAADLDGNGSPDLVIGGNGNNAPIRILFNGTDVTPPPGFDLIAPKNGVVALSPLTPMLVWGESVGFQVAFTVTMATDPAMKDVIHEATGLTNSSYDVPDGVLEAGTQYYWTVTASNPQGDTSAANGPFTFTTLILGDLNSDGTVNITDLLLLLANWGGA